MTARASHPDDTTARAGLGRDLAAARIATGLTSEAVAIRAGLTRSARSVAEHATDMLVWVAQRRARDVDHRLRMAVTGLPAAAPTPESELMAAMTDRGDPDRGDELDRLRLGCLLRRIRAAEKIPVAELAQRCGWSRRMCVYVLSGANEPLLSTVQRLTRGLGGVLGLGLVPAGGTRCCTQWAIGEPGHAPGCIAAPVVHETSVESRAGVGGPVFRSVCSCGAYRSAWTITAGYARRDGASHVRAAPGEAW